MHNYIEKFGVLTHQNDEFEDCCFLGKEKCKELNEIQCEGQELTQIAYDNEPTYCRQQLQLTVDGPSFLYNLEPEDEVVFVLVTSNLAEEFLGRMSLTLWTPQNSVRGMKPQMNGVNTIDFAMEGVGGVSKGEDWRVEFRLTRLDFKRWKWGQDKDDEVEIRLVGPCGDNFYVGSSVKLGWTYKRDAPDLRFADLHWRNGPLYWTPEHNDERLEIIVQGFPEDYTNPSNDNAKLYNVLIDLVMLQYRRKGTEKW